MTSKHCFSIYKRSVARFVMLVALIAFSLAAAAHATTYYVSNSGSDSNSGTSSMTPWQTLAHASSHSYSPGDSILLNGGQTFTGPLTMNSSGNSSAWITIGAYGSGMPTINAGTGDGIDSTNVSYVIVENIAITSSSGGYDGYGINFNATSGNQSYIYFYNVSAQNFATGIIVQTNGGTYNYVTCYACSAFSNGTTGMYIEGNNNSSSATSNFYNVQVSSSNFYSNGAHTKGGGSGLLLQGVDGATVQNSTAYSNGDIGMWCFNSTGIIFTNDVAHDNLAGNGDGGFDLDLGTTNSTIEYSYAYNNGGEGFEMCAGTSNPSSNLTLRYNISENDHYPIAFCGAPFNDIYIYNNTIYTNLSNGIDYWAALNSWSTTPTNLVIANNIIWNANSSEYDLQWGAGGITLNYNDYYGAFEAYFNGAAYTSLSSFHSATGLEANGLTYNPDFTGTPGSKVASAYQLGSSSPLRTAGVNLQAVYGINPGTHDYYGNTLPSSGFSMGAFQ